MADFTKRVEVFFGDRTIGAGLKDLGIDMETYWRISERGYAKDAVLSDAQLTKMSRRLKVPLATIRKEFEAAKRVPEPKRPANAPWQIAPTGARPSVVPVPRNKFATAKQVDAINRRLDVIAEALLALLDLSQGQPGEMESVRARLREDVASRRLVGQAKPAPSE